jgi:hypothetical protein
MLKTAVGGLRICDGVCGMQCCIEGVCGGLKSFSCGWQGCLCGVVCCMDALAVGEGCGILFVG